MKTLNIEQIVALHTLLIVETGGSDGIRDAGRLEAVVATQTQEVFGQQTYQGYFQKAAAIARGIVGDHPFVDGNKRTAMLAALTFLEVNNYKFQAKPKELEDFAVQIATDSLDIPTIAEWFKSHTKATK